MSFFLRFFLIFLAMIPASYLLTTLYIKAAHRYGWLDRPGPKKLHDKPVVTMGGIPIFLAVWGGLFGLIPANNWMADAPVIFVSSFIVLMTGIIDDQIELKPWQKMTGILLAANVLYFFTNIRMDSLILPIVGEVELGMLSYFIMMLWISAITNSVNLMDGLDGLAAGTSIISLTTIGLISNFFTATTLVSVVVMIFLMVAVLLGFLPHNFYPARVFMGDTGALFIGFMIAVLSLFGLKHATFISLLIPVAILGVPITDTLAAIIRRVSHKQAISTKDWGHLHHRLLRIGFTHRQTVLVIYAIGIIFSLTALLFPLSSFLGSVILTVGLTFGVLLFIASINLLSWRRLQSGQDEKRRSGQDEEEEMEEQEQNKKTG